MASIVYLTKEQINAAVGSGKNLGLSPVQCDSLNANFKNKVSEYLKNLNTVSVVEPTNEADLASSVTDVLNSDVISSMPVNEDAVLSSPPLVDEAPVVASPSVVDTSSLNDSMNSDVIQPFAPDAPAMDSVLNMGGASEIPKGQDVPVIPPAIEESNDVNLEASSVNSVQPEIVSVVQETDFDLMKKEIAAVTEDYKDKVIQIMEVYEKKINETIHQANEYKEKAQEHLKNAQAAEQIAEIARQNSRKVQDLQNSVELEKIV